MKDLSLHLLDIARNSVAAGACTLRVELTEGGGLLTLAVADDGPGIPPRLLETITDPFSTTRTTRKVGLGLPLLRLAAEQTGGSLTVESREGEGTTVTAVFHIGHIDCPPAGDMAGAVALIIQGAPGMEVHYRRACQAGEVCLDTCQLRTLLGPDVPLSEPQVVLWIGDYLRQLESVLHA